MAALHWNDVAERKGQGFTLRADEFEMPLTLVDLQQLPHARREGGAFRLEFRGAVDPILPQDIYKVSGDGFEEEIFLVPIGREAEGTRYEAIYT